MEDLGFVDSSALGVEEVSKAMSDGNDYSDVGSFSANVPDQSSAERYDAESVETSQTQDSVASEFEGYVHHEL